MIPPDSLYLPDHIDEVHETALLSSIDNSAWLGDLKRRVQHYGFRYDYKARRVTAASRLGPLPDWLAALTDRLSKDGIFPTAPDQVIVNEYLPGQGIAPHVDCEPCFGNTIASLSLGSACLMEFSSLHAEEAFSHYLEPRSLLVLKNQARLEWKHGIAARKSDFIEGRKSTRERRVSLTFRSVILSG